MPTNQACPGVPWATGLINGQEIAFARLVLTGTITGRVLDRLWEIAKMAPEMTVAASQGQVKAISMIVAMEGLIPNRSAGSAENNPRPSTLAPEYLSRAKTRRARHRRPRDHSAPQQVRRRQPLWLLGNNAAGASNPRVLLCFRHQNPLCPTLLSKENAKNGQILSNFTKTDGG
jgi:hypothetical protein